MYCVMAYGLLLFWAFVVERVWFRCLCVSFVLYCASLPAVLVFACLYDCVCGLLTVCGLFVICLRDVVCVIVVLFCMCLCMICWKSVCECIVGELLCDGVWRVVCVFLFVLWLRVAGLLCLCVWCVICCVVLYGSLLCCVCLSCSCSVWFLVKCCTTRVDCCCVFVCVFL